MNHIKDFKTYINENRPSKITIDGKTNTITIDGETEYKNVATKEIFNEIDDVTRTPFIKDLTGGYKGEFDDTVRSNIETLEKIRNTKKYPEVEKQGDIYYVQFPETDPNEEKEEDKKFVKKDLETIFKIKPKRGDIGSGEVLFAAYYQNVKRNLLKSQGGESGDCHAIVGDKKTHKKIYIEIKAADAHFWKIDYYMNKYNITIKDSELDEGVKKNEKYPFVAGLAAYIYKEKKDTKENQNEFHFILFDNEIRNTNIKGYLTVIRRPGEKIESLINKLMKITEFSSQDDTRGGKKSRDFTISYENGKIQIHIRKKE